MNRLDTIKNIKNYDVTFLILQSGNRKWITAYARLPKPQELLYEYETFRDGDILGIDTAHIRNWNMSLNEKRIDAEYQITSLITDYIERR